MIQQHIDTQKAQVETLERQVRNMPKQVQKKTLVGGIHHMVRSAFQLATSVLPFQFLKNRLLGGITSALMLNYSIRSMRKPFYAKRNNLDQEYENMANQLTKNVNSLSYYNRICSDSLYQVMELKQEILKEFQLYQHDPSVLSLLGELEELENVVSAQRGVLTKTEKKMEHQKQKILRRENL